MPDLRGVRGGNLGAHISYTTKSHYPEYPKRGDLVSEIPSSSNLWDWTYIT